MNIRGYQKNDYPALKELYMDSSTYGGQFDEARDAEDRLKKKINADPSAILVAEDGARLVGTVSPIEDGRVAWLFRFCVVDQDVKVANELKNRALEILKERGHDEVLVYSPVNSKDLDERYQKLKFNKGNGYTVYLSKT